jgi:branched-chain amino acid transport system substrate-binding protein
MASPAASPVAAPVAAPAAGTVSGEVKIGAHLSLTGSAAFAGVIIRKGIELAVDELNQSKYLGPNASVSLLVGDDATDKTQGVNLLQKFINQDRVLMVVGGTLTPVVQAATPIAQQSGVPFVIANPSTPRMTLDGDYIFRTSQVYTPFFKDLVDATVPKYGWKTAAIVYGNDNESTVTMYNDYKRFMEPYGVKFVVEEGITAKDTDFTGQLTKVRAAKPDVLLPMLIGPQAAALILQARQMGIEAPILGQQAHNSPDMYRIASDAVVGEIVPAHWFMGTEFPRNRAFVDAYRKKFNEDPEQFSANGYQATWYAAMGIKAGGSATDRQAAQRGLLSVKQFDGIFGPDGKITVDENREAKVKGVILQIGPGGKIQLWQP